MAKPDEFDEAVGHASQHPQNERLLHRFATITLKATHFWPSLGLALTATPLAKGLPDAGIPPYPEPSPVK